MNKILQQADRGRAKSRIEQAEARIEQAESRTEQAKTRVESAETRVEQAETRTESAKSRTENAETRTEQAETRTEQAETRAEQAETLLENLLQKPGAQAETVTPENTADSLALERLTARQREILQLLARGGNAKQIADVLKVSPKTIEYHRGRLMTSLNLHDIPGLVRFALRVGLILPHD